MIPSFMFDANNTTPEQLARKRAIAEAMMGGFGRAQNVGEGVGDLLTGVGLGVHNRRLNKAEKANTERGNAAFSSIFSGFGGGSSAPAPQSFSTDTPEQAYAQSRVEQAHGGSSNYRDAIASIESEGSGDYAAVGPTHPKLGRALGRYQVMEANIAPWSKAALGREVSAEEFLANPELQDKIFDHQFGQYVSQFGPEGAAQAWFAGPGGVGELDRKDVLGTDVGSYGNKFMAALGDAPQGGSTAAVNAMAQGGNAPQAGAQSPMASMIPAQFQGSQQLMNADPTKGILQALLAGQPQGAQGQPQAQGSFPAAPVPQQQPNRVQQLYQAMSNPYLSDSQKQVVGAMLEQEIAQQQQANDPMRQLQLEKARIELEEKRNPEPEYRPLINSGDGRVYDPNTGEWIMAPDAGEDIPDAVRSLDIRAKRAGLEEGTPEYNEFMINGGRSGMAIRTNPDGSFEMVSGGGKLTENQSKLTLFRSLQTETQPVLLDLESRWDPTNLTDAAARSTPIAGNFFQSEEGQMYQSAATAWAEGALRIATGAAATPEEMERTKKAYFAQPGDTPNTIAFKAQMREMYDRSIQRALGKNAEGSLPKPDEFAKEVSKANGQSPVPEGVDPELWEFMTPEERSLWQ